MSILSVENLRLSRGEREILTGVSLEVRVGEIVALMGASGAGKSTILRCIAALEPFQAGRITVGDAQLEPGPVSSQSRLQVLRRTVGFVFQSPALFDHMSAIDNVMLAPVHAQQMAPDRAREDALRLLTELGVSARAAAFPRELSGGEAQRVAIARALATHPDFLLMDEPTSALDPERRKSLVELFRALAGNGRGLLIATHDEQFAHAVADDVRILRDGVVQYA